MRLILPMAGDSSRFRDYSPEPKYLIEVKGRPMLRLGLLGVECGPAETVAVLRHDHCERFGAADRVAAAIGPGARVARVGRTRGAAETVLLGLRDAAVPGDEPICVKDVDCVSIPDEGWRERVERTARSAAEGAIAWVGVHDDGLAPAARDTNKSHVESTPDGGLLDIREKVRLSPLFVAGIYVFSSARVFERAAEAVLSRPAGAEAYLSHVVKEVMASGGRGMCLRIREYADLGTPEALRRYLGSAV